jgi:hypothetical protein
VKAWLLGGPLHGEKRVLPDDRASEFRVIPYNTLTTIYELVYVRDRRERYEVPDGYIPFVWEEWVAEDRTRSV